MTEKTLLLKLDKSLKGQLFFDDLHKTFADIEKISAQHLIEIANEIFDKNQLSSLIFTPN